MNIRKRLGAMAMVAAIAGTGLVYSGSTASAATCYGGAIDYSKPKSVGTLPHAGHYYATTSRCGDINLRSNTNRYVKVCFYKYVPSKGSFTLNYCQSDYTLTTAGKWTVIATNVKDNTVFHYRFRSSARSTGQTAH